MDFRSTKIRIPLPEKGERIHIPKDKRKPKYKTNIKDILENPDEFEEDDLDIQVR